MPVTEKPRNNWCEQFGINDAQLVYNLNEAEIPTDSRYNDTQQDFSCASGSTGLVEVIFKGLEDRLVKMINGSDFVVGCTAWLTNDRILDALASLKYGCSIVVSKEDFLRPDMVVGEARNRARVLRDKYDRLKCEFDRCSLFGLGRLNYCGDPTVPPVRCFGKYNEENLPGSPKMHHKFLIFSRVLDNAADTTKEKETNPYAVWTGSFNTTQASVYSLENALILHSKQIVAAFVNEYEQIFSLSEALDWKHKWVAPGYRIGS